MSLLDPVTVNRQIDAYLASVPAGKRVVLLGQASLVEKKAGATLVVRATDWAGAYLRVSKVSGQKLETEAGFKISLLYDDPDVLHFTYPELVEVFRARGFGWVRSHLAAYRLMKGGEVEL